MSQDNPFLEELCEKFLHNTVIPNSAYEKYDIKRGLRNSDGTGVMAGITRIGSVQGYIMRDGERVPAPGQLFYRGIDIQKIVDGFWTDNRQGMAEVAYLLLFGELPNMSQYNRFSSSLTEFSPLPSGWVEDILLKSPSTNIMNMLARSVLALYAHDDLAEDTSLPNMMRQCIRLIAVFPSLVASAYAALNNYYSSKDVQENYNSKTISENFLFRLRQDHRYSVEEARLLDLCMVLHAEHGGGNNSTFSCRVLSSTGTDTYSAIAGAVTSLKGPLHGGANIKVTQMLRDIISHLNDPEDEDEICDYLKRILRKEAGDGSGKIYGMGHAIYTLSDPRAVLLKEHARKLIESRDESLKKEFALMERIEWLAPRIFQDIKKDDKTISANVDFYSGFIYRILDIPEELFTPLFAIARVCGWAAHRIEETTFGGRIIRPAYKAIDLESQYWPMSLR